MIDEKKLIENITKYHNSLKPSYITRLVESVFGDIVDIINEQPKVGEWILVEERLPECEWGYETKELMYQLKNTGSIEIGYYGEGGHYRDRYFRTYRDSYEGVDASEVIAWMPLPAPYDMRKKVE